MCSVNKTEQAAHSSERAQALRAELFGQDLSVDEVAHILDVDRTTILRYLGDGVIFGFLLGRSWHIPMDDFRSYVSALRAGRLPGNPREEVTAARGALAEIYLAIVGDPNRSVYDIVPHIRRIVEKRLTTEDIDALDQDMAVRRGEVSVAIPDQPVESKVEV